MISGKVRHINSDKGYLFIRPTDGSKDCFAHFSILIEHGIQPTGLQVGDDVEFERGPSRRPDKDQVVRIQLVR